MAIWQWNYDNGLLKWVMQTLRFMLASNNSENSPNQIWQYKSTWFTFLNALQVTGKKDTTTKYRCISRVSHLWTVLLFPPMMHWKKIATTKKANFLIKDCSFLYSFLLHNTKVIPWQSQHSQNVNSILKEDREQHKFAHKINPGLSF